MRFTVHQIKIERSVYDQVNKLGHEGAATTFPEYRAKMDTMFGSKGYKAEYEQFYAPVCEIDAEDLEGVFLHLAEDRLPEHEPPGGQHTDFIL